MAKIPNFDNGNPTFEGEHGETTQYTVDERFGWRRRVFKKEGITLIDRAPVRLFDGPNGFWRPWNDPPPDYVRESDWQPVGDVIQHVVE